MLLLGLLLAQPEGAPTSRPIATHPPPAPGRTNSTEILLRTGPEHPFGLEIGKISVEFVREPAVPEARTDGCTWSANHGTAPTELLSILVQNLLTYY